MISAPFVEPSTPELLAHHWGIGTEFFETGELMVDIGSCAKVHGPYYVVETILLEV